MADVMTLASDRLDAKTVILDQTTFKLVRENELGVLQLTTRHYTTTEHDVLETLIGEQLPHKPNTVLSDGHLSIAWIASGQWYAIGPTNDVVSRRDRWAAALTGQTALCLDMSDQLAVLHLQGAVAAELMSSLIPIDFGLWAQDQDKCLRTALTDFSLFVERRESAKAFRLIVDQSYCDIACSLLCDAATGRLLN